MLDRSAIRAQRCEFGAVLRLKRFMRLGGRLGGVIQDASRKGIVIRRTAATGMLRAFVYR